MIKCVMHSKSDNTEIMINDEANEVIKELFDSFKNRYQNNLESMKGSEFVFDYVQSLYYKCHKTNPNRGGSCRVKLELLTDIDMLLMAEKGITGGIGHAIHRYAKANKYMKNYDKIKESSSAYLKY